MSVTVKPILRSSKTRTDGRAPIWIRITANRKSRYVSTGVYVEPKYWNEKKQKVRKSHELASAFNAKIRRLRLDAEEAALQSSSAQAVKAELKSDTGGLSRYFDQFIERLRDREKYWERKKYNTTCNKLQEALGENLSFSDLTPQALEKVERHCREVRGNNPNTTRKELSRIRRVINQAIKEGVLSAGEDPFLRYDLPDRVPPDRHSISYKDVQALEQLDLAKGSEEMRNRDAFVLSFYGGGIRFSDICQLRHENISKDRLRYRMMKTSQVVAIPLPDVALTIVERWKHLHDGEYLFPYLKDGDDADPVHLRKRISSCNVLTNRGLKDLARDAEIDHPDKLTFHVARHSFADFARQQSGDLYAVSKALGHSNLSITERYLAAFDQDAVDTLTKQIWNDE